MTNLQTWEDKIKRKRWNTDYRQFIKELASWYSVVFYKNKDRFSVYSENSGLNIVDLQEFIDLQDGFLDYWIDYDFGVDFFHNFEKVFKKVPLPNVIHIGWENANYSDAVVFSKNAYLSFIVINNCENILYSFNIKDNCKNILNSIMVWGNCENVYMWTGIIKWFNIFYSKYISNSNNIWFSSNLVGCSECIFCDWLENQQYHIENKKYSKQDYEVKKKEILSQKNEFNNFYNWLNKKGLNYWSNSVSWSYILNSENITNWNLLYQVKNWKNLLLVGWIDGTENMCDVFTSGSPYWNNFFAVVGAGWCDNIFATYGANGWGTNIYYSYHLDGCSFCLGCVWLQNKQFCILNKQYNKEEWYELANKIFSQMEKDWILGDFFPWRLNPYYFNDTMAYLIDNDFRREELEKDGYMWREEEIKVDIPAGLEVVEIKDLNNYQWYDENWDWQINPEILKKVIKDENWNVYRIVKMEYDFLQKQGLPLPEMHWLERIKLWFSF